MHEIIEGFKKLLDEHGPACISSAMGILHGNDGAMDEGMKPILPGFDKICGPARTIKFGPRTATDVRGTASGGGFDYYNVLTDSLKPGDVLVVDLGGNYTWSSGPYGGNRNKMVKNMRAAGVLLDGYTRDLPELRSNPLPLFCRGVSVRLQGLKPIAMECEVKCGGINVNPGDIICGDESGVVVVPHQKAEEILKDAIDNASLDTAVFDALVAGMSATDATKRRSPEAVKKLNPKWTK
jgi:regulator of RNase E activity RraA